MLAAAERCRKRHALSFCRRGKSSASEEGRKAKPPPVKNRLGLGTVSRLLLRDFTAPAEDVSSGRFHATNAACVRVIREEITKTEKKKKNSGRARVPTCYCTVGQNVEAPFNPGGRDRKDKKRKPEEHVYEKVSPSRALHAMPAGNGAMVRRRRDGGRTCLQRPLSRPWLCCCCWGYIVSRRYTTDPRQQCQGGLSLARRLDSPTAIEGVPRSRRKSG